MDKYQDRRQAGVALTQELLAYKGRRDVLVLALPRGGVPVAFEVAKALGVPLDVFIVRKLGVPGYAELAMGAIASGGQAVFNQDVVQQYHVSEDEMAAVIRVEKNELARREVTYRQGRAFPSLSDKTVILIDDGIATGATMRAAIQALRGLNVHSLVVAVPVADMAICESMSGLVDAFICPLQPRALSAVGAWYHDFSQTEDNEVSLLLSEAPH